MKQQQQSGCTYTCWLSVETSALISVQAVPASRSHLIGNIAFEWDNDIEEDRIVTPNRPLRSPNGRGKNLFADFFFLLTVSFPKKASSNSFEALFTQDAPRDAHANWNVFPLILLACSVNTPIDDNRSHLLRVASRVLCELGLTVSGFLYLFWETDDCSSGQQIFSRHLLCSLPRFPLLMTTHTRAHTTNLPFSLTRTHNSPFLLFRKWAPTTKPDWNDWARAIAFFSLQFELWKKFPHSLVQNKS